MKIVSLDASDVVPVKKFAISDLSDAVILAGPNGVGKTRLVQGILGALQAPTKHPNIKLVVVATSETEKQEWGKRQLDLGTVEDQALYSKTLRKTKRRSNWTSSVLQFESDRTIQRIDPLPFSWDMPDPWDEQLGWNYSFGYMKDRFNDTRQSLFKKIYNQQTQIASEAQAAMKRGEAALPLNYPDPMLPFKDAFRQLLGPKEMVDPNIRQQTLSFLHEGKPFGFEQLSSGEREVVNITFDFLLRNPTDCIVFFDEPELHLHPELTYRLLQTLKTIGARNQFFFCTHSPEIIGASLDDTVVFVSPPKVGRDNQAIHVRENDETHEALKLLGQTIGLISLGKRLVLIEGQHSSLDKQVYGSILRNLFPSLILVPSGGKDTIRHFETLQRNVLDKTIWGVEFFLLCDRDAVPLSRPAAQVEKKGQGRLRVLPRYHLENYFLDSDLLARAISSITLDPGHPFSDPARVEATLIDLARPLVSYCAALVVSAELREYAGNIDVMPKDCRGKSSEELTGMILARAIAERTRVDSVLSDHAVTQAVRETVDRLQRSLDMGNQDWKKEIPGRPLLATFCSRAKIDVGYLKSHYLREAATASTPFSDIIAIFKTFADSTISSPATPPVASAASRVDS
ncbi:MAG: ATP-binding protein [Planctomycetes bacterium]|nr:ATP-binding protein [Planctomycetota bacterium]